MAESGSLIFQSIPAILHKQGRIEGFEALRDALLEHVDELSSNPLAVIKMVLETDRHALFAQVAEEKARLKRDVEAYDEFRRYLAGDIDSLVESPPPIPMQAAKTPKLIETETEEEENGGQGEVEEE